MSRPTVWFGVRCGAMRCGFVGGCQQRWMDDSSPRVRYRLVSRPSDLCVVVEHRRAGVLHVKVVLGCGFDCSIKY